GSYWFWGTAVVVRHLLKRDHGDDRSSALTNRVINCWILHNGVLTAVAGILQRKSDRCSGRRESERGF
ncbi:hypothetical protein HAX54_002890, partial [Datura stramonium]|nr:hypothetical protein [Datura stramonium]